MERPEKSSKEAINVGLSIQERIKLLNQKSVELPKEKSLINTGSTVKERLAALQQTSKVSQPKDSVVSPNFIPLAQRKEDWIKSNKNQEKVVDNPLIPEEKKLESNEIFEDSDEENKTVLVELSKPIRKRPLKKLNLDFE